MTAIERRLSAHPQDADLLGLKGFALAMAGRLDEALATVRLAVELAATPALRLKHAGNLARLLARTGRKDDIVALAASLPDVLAGLGPGNVETNSIENLCEPLLIAERYAEVAAFLAPLRDAPAAAWTVEQLWLRAATGAGQHAQIFARVDGPGYPWREKAEAASLASAAAAALGRNDACRSYYDAYLAGRPVYVAPRRATQIMSIVVISSDPDIPSLRLPFVQQHAAGNFPAQLMYMRPDRYRFLSVFAGSPPRPIEAELGPDEKAITLNNCVNGEMLKRGELAAVEAQEKALGLPVVNAAAGAIHCTRVETADSLRGIANLVVPKAMRFRLEEPLLAATRRAIGELFSFPVLLRTVGEQEGLNIHLARNEAAVGQALADLLGHGGRDIYVIEYAGTEYTGGFFRRIRAAYVEGTPTLMRADYDAQWMVKGRKNERIQKLYLGNRRLFDEAQRVVSEPQRIGQAAWTALEEIGKRMPLEVFGIDFDVDHQGRVVFFEANATMNLLSNAPPEIDYPQDAQNAFLKRLDDMFLRRGGVALH